MWTSLLITLLVCITGTTSEQACELQKSVELTNRTYNGVLYQDGEYFADNVTGVERGCVCLKGVCSRKCCPPGMGYDLRKKDCVNITDAFDPPVWDGRTILEGYNVTKEFVFMYGKMVCERDKGENRVSVYPATKTFRLRKDGKLYVNIPSSTPSIFLYEPDKYCIDTFVTDEEHRLNALICFVSNTDEHNYLLSSSCMLVSCFFILLTVAVYAFVPEMRNLHGMVMMAYLLSFFVGFLFMATMQILILKGDIGQAACTSLTFIIYFALLSAFFWLNVMCYDIWWTFSGKRAHGRSSIPKKRFMGYCIYAFGVPTALTVLTAALEFSNLPIEHPLLPKIRLQGCFLFGTSKLIYLYTPIVVLCVANLTFFTLTAIKIAKIKNDTAILRQSRDNATNNQTSGDTQRFGLYVKLFIVMGVNWVLEVVSSFFPKANFFWQFSDAYNVLVGLIIFLIFVCKKQTWELIKKRYYTLQGRPVSRTQTTNSTSTRTLSVTRDEMQLNTIKN